MTLAREPITTSPRTPSHMRVVIDRLRRQAASASGVIFPGTGIATVAISAGEVVYAPSAGNLDLAIASGLSTSQVVGLAKENASIGDMVVIQTTGVIENTSWALTTNTIYYLDPSTAGGITDTAPTTTGQTVVPIGIAVSATELKLLIPPPILL